MRVSDPDCCRFWYLMVEKSLNHALLVPLGGQNKNSRRASRPFHMGVLFVWRLFSHSVRLHILNHGVKIEFGPKNKPSCAPNQTILQEKNRTMFNIRLYKPSTTRVIPLIQKNTRNDCRDIVRRTTTNSSLQNLRRHLFQICRRRRNNIGRSWTTEKVKKKRVVRDIRTTAFLSLGSVPRSIVQPNNIHVDSVWLWRYQLGQK